MFYLCLFLCVGNLGMRFSGVEMWAMHKVIYSFFLTLGYMKIKWVILEVKYLNYNLSKTALFVDIDVVLSLKNLRMYIENNVLILH